MSHEILTVQSESPLNPDVLFAELSPWQIAHNTITFAREVEPQLDDSELRSTKQAIFVHEGSKVALVLQARGENPKKITITGKVYKGGDETPSDPFRFVITKDGVRVGSTKELLDEAGETKLRAIMGRANLQLTMPSSLPQNSGNSTE